MTSDDILGARVAARHAELRGAAGRRLRTGRLRTFHLRLWWAVRPRREIACLVTTPDGAAVLSSKRPWSRA